MGPGGGPITNEGAGGEVYHTIYYIAESPHSKDVIYAGADDGLVHITTDGGRSWKNISNLSIYSGIFKIHLCSLSFVSWL